MKNKKQIGYIVNITENVRKEFLSKLKNKGRFICIEIFEDKKYGAVARLYERNSFFDRYQETTTLKQRKKYSEALSKVGSDDKPVDTSKWVKPDIESIRNELIKNLFFLHIIKEDCWEWRERYGKAHALYSVLHSHSPKNPQSLTNFAIGSGDTYFQTIMAEFKSTEHKKFWDNFNKDFNKKNKGKEHWENRRKNFKKWAKETLQKMIIKDSKPSKFEKLKIKDVERK